MNIKDNRSNKPVSAYPLFKGKGSHATAIELKPGGQLKEHITKTEALLICVEGSVRFANEHGTVVDLKSGDYIVIEPMVIHWLEGLDMSQLILIK